MMDSASQVATDISNAISAKKLEITEKKHSLEMMKKAMVIYLIYIYIYIYNNKIRKSICLSVFVLTIPSNIYEMRQVVYGWKHYVSIYLRRVS